jgi:CHAT domain-containing protein
LEYLPFSALLSSIDDGQNTPLIADHEIVYLPSASALAQLRNQELHRKRANKAVAILADPVFNATDERVIHHSDSLASAKQLSSEDEDNIQKAYAQTRGNVSQLGRLLYTRNEAQAVLAVSPANETLLALDFSATRNLAMSSALADYRIVHFATHGVLDNKHPELSGLVLSLVDQHGRAQAGFLSLQDIYNMKLPADLVVLSGCETGLGEEINGEGLIGLTRGFMSAGAPRVVASLWKVSDVATAFLMADFYKFMQKDNLRPAAALRAAQLKMSKSKQWGSPYYWAAFTLQGDWK